jgi:uncharacterized protein YmfQ (DUF2313 family)
MGMSRDAYLSQLQMLLPPGAAWSQDQDALLTRLLDGLAEEFARIDGRAAQLIDECDPRTTSEMISDWESVAGLSTTSSVDGSALSMDQRQSNLVSSITERGGQSPAYFIALVLRLGFVVTITEFHEWSVIDDVQAALNGTDWNFAWQINAPLVTTSAWSVDSDTEAEFTIIWINEIMESVFYTEKPAQSVLLFSYS